MSNALAQATSPYLLQHADNPVDWLEWGPEAFARARAEDKPIFLSIGYSTCHWCHVMAHESFEDETVAALVNRDFIAIKVDREERPDVDRVYMAFVQASTGQGGWPMSVWLTPDLKPFYGGTYYPPEDRHGRPGFPSLLASLAGAWRDRRDELLQESERVMGTLTEHYAGKLSPADPDHDFTDEASEAFERGYQYFFENYDAGDGGFGHAPKFPRASVITFLLRCAVIQGLGTETGREAVGMASTTLRKMAAGGIHDHVGGGFHRYSVDSEWFVPHFEKMLYDQAQISINYLDVFQATGDERYAWIARGIFEYVQRDLRDPAGGFYSAEDADSMVFDGDDAGRTKREGAFYVWTQAELAAALTADELALVSAHFGLMPEGNVDPARDPHHEFTGRNILIQVQALGATADALGLAPEVAVERLASALAKLRTVRVARPRPHLDDKVLTAWNGLMISALARGAQLLPNEGYLPPAQQAAGFLRQTLWSADTQTLYRSWRQGKRGTTAAFAEDYAYLIQGLLDLYEADFDHGWLRWATELQAKMDSTFWDDASGGYFNSAADATDIVLRLKEDYDGAEPAPTSVGAQNLLRLGHLLTDQALLDRGRTALQSLQAQWHRAPAALPQLLVGMELALTSPRHVVIAGTPGTADFAALANIVHRAAGSRRIIVAVDGGAGQAWLARQAPWLAEMRPIDGQATAYICEDFTCQPPVTDPMELALRLRGLPKGDEDVAAN